MSSMFPGSAVLEQNSAGHCSPSDPSVCTAYTIKKYFQTGELPREGMVCEPYASPFEPEKGYVGLSAEDQTLLEALRQFQDRSHRGGGRLGI